MFNGKFHSVKDERDDGYLSRVLFLFRALIQSSSPAHSVESLTLNLPRNIFAFV